jgi:hypothetical protein
VTNGAKNTIDPLQRTDMVLARGMTDTLSALPAAPLQGRGGKPREWEAERLLFINDVFFCAKDIIRLLQHTNVALTCGMDFNFVSCALMQHL